MPAYVIAHVDVKEPVRYEDYKRLVLDTMTPFGGRFLVRGGRFETVAGTSRSRNVVLEFPSYEAALACWQSPEYQAAKAKQEGGADVDMIVIEGYEGPQPS